MMVQALMENHFPEMGLPIFRVTGTAAHFFFPSRQSTSIVLHNE
jgi:hypothetical protein